MKVIAVDGGPRRDWNTGALIEKALEGAREAGAETRRVRLYELGYRGCLGCLACKRKDSAQPSRCAVKDDLYEVLRAVEESDALVLGSPIYFGNVTGQMRSFLERLLFQYISYDEGRVPQTPKQIPNLAIYTMNVSETMLGEIGYTRTFESYRGLFERLLGPSRYLCATETLQTDDYGAHRMSMFDEGQRKDRRRDVFPLDCEKAFEMGKALVSQR